MEASPAPNLGATLLELYDEALPAVYGYLRRRVGSDSAAQDITSETFLAAVASIKTSQSVTVSVGWLIGIARHKLVDHYRQVARLERGLNTIETPIQSLAGPGQLSGEIVLSALEELGAHHRSALVLRYFDGLPVGEVADHLGRTLHATEALLVRARSAFRASYERQLEEFSK
jgi:RNA polymerase sigma-70 factor, ECF subfamily